MRRTLALALALALALGAPVAAARTRSLEVFLHPVNEGTVHLQPTGISANVGETLALTVYNAAPENGTAHDLVVCRGEVTRDACADVVARTGAIAGGGYDTIQVPLTRGNLTYLCELGCSALFRDPARGFNIATIEVTSPIEEQDTPALALPLLALALALALALRRRDP